MIALNRAKVVERLVQPPLARAAKAVIAKHRPLVVGISGSVGKTSAKDAVACVLREWKPTMSSPDNQNDELGVPLSIVDARPSGSNPFGWIATLRRARRMLGAHNGSYPDCLVLEFGSCHVGDVEYLMQLSTPDVGVLTAIEATHLEFYGSPEAIELEEGKIVTMLPSSGAGIVNVDNPGAAAAVGRASCRVVTYGFDAAAQVRGLGAVSSVDWDRLTGHTHLELQCGEERGTLAIEGTLGSHSCYAPLAALGVSQAVGIPFAQAVRALHNYVPPAGRMRCRAGLEHSLVIDDSYNSSPAATIKALDVLADLSASRECTEAVAVLGPMTELGPISRSQHEAVGRHVAGLGLDCLVTVGDQAGDTARAARDAEMPADRVLELGGTEEAIRVLTARMKRGAVLLVKGSRSCGMERVADALAEGAEGHA